LHNTAKDFSWHTVSPGDKIAQMVILPVPEMQVVEVQELEESDRGEKGFGSSGK
jgi:dUTP pyrophosphatase